MKQIAEKLLVLEQVQTQQQQVMDLFIRGKVKVIVGQDISGHHDNIQEMFNQMESFETRQRKNNMRLKILKEQVEVWICGVI